MNPLPSPPATMVARTPADLVAVVPTVLGFHPQDSVVLLTFGPAGRPFHARVDLPLVSSEQAQVADLLARAARTNGVGQAAVLLYSDDAGAADAQADVLVDRLLEHDVEVIAVLRVDDDHWHQVPDEGTPGTSYDLEAHRFTAQSVFEGRVVHRDRAELEDTLVGTDEEDAVEVALAATRHADVMLALGRQGLDTETSWLRWRVRAALADPVAVDARDAGRLLVLASVVPTRDVAWAEITRAEARSHADLWRGLVRRAPRDLVPGAASLLAFAAWQAGDGALAWCALDRALGVDPDYSMAHGLAQLLTAAVPPDTWVAPDGAASPPLGRD